MAVLKDVYAGFVTTIKGMVVTWKELFVPAVTVQYPYQKREMPDRMRGMVVNDAVLCIACDKCVKICPVDCLYCEATGKGKERRPSVFTIDYVKCCWCELCVDVCPVDSIYMSKDYETVFTDRSQMIRDFVKDPIPPIQKPDAEAEKKVETQAAGQEPVAKESSPKGTRESDRPSPNVESSIGAAEPGHGANGEAGSITAPVSSAGAVASASPQEIGSRETSSESSQESRGGTPPEPALVSPAEKPAQAVSENDPGSKPVAKPEQKPVQQAASNPSQKPKQNQSHKSGHKSGKGSKKHRQR